MEIFNPQLLSQYAKLDSIQVVQLLMLILVGGLAWINLRQQALAKQSSDNFNKTTSQLLGNMQTQQTQSNDREGKLATAIEHGAKESNKIGRVLLLIHKEQKRQSSVSADQHAALMKRVEELASQMTREINEIRNKPDQTPEVLRRLDQLLGYVEGLRLKNRTGELAKLSTGETFRIESNAVRSETDNGFKMEVVENPT